MSLPDPQEWSLGESVRIRCLSFHSVRDRVSLPPS